MLPQTDQNLQIAVAQNYPPALVYFLGGGPFELDPCTSAERLSWNETLNVLERYSAMDEKMQKFEILQKYVEGIVASDNYHATLLGGTANVALSLANMASDCAYATEPLDGSYGIRNPELAMKLVQLAASSEMELAIESFRGKHALAYALAIDLGSGGEGKHYAAGRFLLAGASDAVVSSKHGLLDSRISLDDVFDIWVPRFSRNTIKEAQKLLKREGLYTSVIDGLPGKGFRSAILSLDCRYKAKEHPDTCLLDKPREVRAQAWARPYFTGPR